MLGWHFVTCDTLRDGRPVPKDNEWLEHHGPVIPCRSGLHMSPHPWDALRLSSGYTLCYVELQGDIQERRSLLYDYVDKVAGRRRRIIARIDAKLLIRRYACELLLRFPSLTGRELLPWCYTYCINPVNDTMRDAAITEVRGSSCIPTHERFALLASLGCPPRQALLDISTAQAFHGTSILKIRDEFHSRVLQAFSLIGIDCNATASY